MYALEIIVRMNRDAQAAWAKKQSNKRPQVTVRPQAESGENKPCK
jgi:hypothetical protein